MENIQKYRALENIISNNNDSSFVVRDTDHPAEDLLRNWSSTVGGVNYEGDFAKETIEETENLEGEYRYHPAHDGFCVVDYEGLGSFQLEAKTITEAIDEANKYSVENDLTLTYGSGDGHFYAEDVISFHKVRNGRYIFELK